MRVATAPAAWRRWVALVLLVSIALLIADVRRAPDRQLTSAMAIRAIHLYQRAFAAPLARLAGGDCRFAPSCSRYAEAAIRHYGLLSGGGRSVVRIARCGPWTPHGTVDLPFEGYLIAASSPK